MRVENTARFSCTDDFGERHVILEWCSVRKVDAGDGTAVTVRGKPFYKTENGDPVTRQGADGFQILSTGIRLQRCQPVE